MSAQIIDLMPYIQKRRATELALQEEADAELAILANMRTDDDWGWLDEWNLPDSAS
jgi:hypothetical protein